MDSARVGQLDTWGPGRLGNERDTAEGKDGKANCVNFHITQYTAAAKTSALDPTANALHKLGALLTRDTKLVTILEAPSLSAADKSAIVAELEKNAGGGETVRNFLNTLAENNRLNLLNGVCAKFSELMSASRGEVEVTVTSATVRVPTPERR